MARRSKFNHVISPEILSLSLIKYRNSFEVLKVQVEKDLEKKGIE